MKEQAAAALISSTKAVFIEFSICCATYPISDCSHCVQNFITFLEMISEGLEKLSGICVHFYCALLGLTRDLSALDGMRKLRALFIMQVVTARDIC